MNDHEAMKRINAAIDDWTSNRISKEDLVMKICLISGMNSFEHALAEEQS